MTRPNTDPNEEGIAGACRRHEAGPMPQAQETKVRGFVKVTIDALLSHPLPN
jgi:hypothetical protein